MLPAIDEGRVWQEIAAWVADKKRPKPYLLAIREWCGFLGVEPGTPAALQAFVKAGSIQAAGYKRWCESLPGYKKSDHRSSSTIRQRLWILKKMYRIIVATGIRCGNPFSLIRIPGPDGGLKRPTRAVPFDAVRRILELPDTRTDRGKMELALLSVAFGAGLRRSEIVNLELRDVAATRGGNTFLRLRETKNGTDADQVLPKWAALNLKAWLDLRRLHCSNTGDPLFISCNPQGQKGCRKGRGLSEKTLYRIFKAYIARAGLDPSLYSPHSSRATAITKLRADGYDIRKVKDFGRFASVEMVDHYDKTQNSVDQQVGLMLSFEEKKDRVG